MIQESMLLSKLKVVVAAALTVTALAFLEHSYSVIQLIVWHHSDIVIILNSLTSKASEKEMLFSDIFQF